MNFGFETNYMLMNSLFGVWMYMELWKNHRLLRPNIVLFTTTRMETLCFTLFK